MRYEVQDDGGVIIYAGNYYGSSEGFPYIEIDREGNIIQQYQRMDYVKILKEKGVKVIMKKDPFVGLYLV